MGSSGRRLIFKKIQCPCPSQIIRRGLGKVPKGAHCDLPLTPDSMYWLRGGGGNHGERGILLPHFWPGNKEVWLSVRRLWNEASLGEEAKFKIRDLEIEQTLWLDLTHQALVSLPGKENFCPENGLVSPHHPWGVICLNHQHQSWLMFSASGPRIWEAVRQMTPSCPSHQPQGPGWSYLLVAPNTTLLVVLTEADAAPIELKWSVIRQPFVPSNFWPLRRFYRTRKPSEPLPRSWNYKGTRTMVSPALPLPCPHSHPKSTSIDSPPLITHSWCNESW